MLSFDVVIVGGGVTGLSAAYEFERRGRETGQYAKIGLIERSDRLGGKLGSIYDEGFLVERSADSLFLKKPEAIELALELGMLEQLIVPQVRRFGLAVHGSLTPVDPRFLGDEEDLRQAIDAADFLSNVEKWRAKLGSRFLHGRRGDLSLARCLRRRYGKKLSKFLFEPLYAGVHAGNATRLSARALYPELFTKKKGKGEDSTRVLQERFGAPYVGFRFGMQSFISTIERRLINTRCFLESELLSIEKGETGGYRLSVLCDGVEVPFQAREVLITLPSFAAAPLVKRISPKLSHALSAIQWSGNTVVTMAFRSEDVQYPFPASGFLVSSGEKTEMLAATFSSRKWEGRAQESCDLLRVFYQGKPDQDVAERAFAELGRYVKLSGKPIKSWVEDWTTGLPQYELGHEKRVRGLERECVRIPGLHVIGSSFHGMSVSDCVRVGRGTAAKLFPQLREAGLLKVPTEAAVVA